MITQHQGLLIGIILLVIMSIICQLTNLLDYKDNFFDLSKEMSIFKPYEGSMEDLNKLNDINYVNITNCKQQPCAAIREPHAKIPCSLLRECGLINKADLPYSLSDTDLKVLMLSTYHDVGREISDRKHNQRMNTIV